MNYAAIQAQAKKLTETCRKYLVAHDWSPIEADGRERWVKVIPWGTASTRRVEADLSDAVNYQARHDGDLK